MHAETPGTPKTPGTLETPETIKYYIGTPCTETSCKTEHHRQTPSDARDTDWRHLAKAFCLCSVYYVCVIVQGLSLMACYLLSLHYPTRDLGCRNKERKLVQSQVKHDF